MPHIAELQRGYREEEEEEADETQTAPPPISSRSAAAMQMDTTALPQPHLPLRKASGSRLQARKGPVPKALYPTHNHQLRGFHPHSNIPSPQQNNVYASDEHAFSGRQARPFKPAIGMLESQHQQNQQQYQYSNTNTFRAERDGGRPPSSPLLPPPESPHFHLKHSRSMGESLRSRVASSSSTRPNTAEISQQIPNNETSGVNSASSTHLTPDLPQSSTMQPPPAIRESFRSQLTSHSSLLGPSSSINTGTHTSFSSTTDANDFVRVTAEDWDGGEDAHYGDVDDLLDAYGDGFESDRASMASHRQRSGQRSNSAKNSLDVRSIRSVRTFGSGNERRTTSIPRSQSVPRPQTQLTPKRSRFEMESVGDSFVEGGDQDQGERERPASQPKPAQTTAISNGLGSGTATTNGTTTTTTTPKRLHAAHRRSQSASILILGVPRINIPGSSPTQDPIPPPPPSPFRQRTSEQILSNQSLRGTDSRPNSASTSSIIPRDRYGFKKSSHYITLEAYDAWNETYTPHIERRSKKWHALMKSYGLSTEPGAVRFPPKSDKIKRYVRKGIPPEFRGNAWFWYAGGPGKLAKSEGLYGRLLRKVEEGGLGDTDREHIERDLQRTFPDNVKFKADVGDGVRDSVRAGGRDSAMTNNGGGRESRAAGRDSSATTGSAAYVPAKSSMLRDSSATTATTPLPVRESSMSSIPARPGPPTRDSSSTTPPILEGTTATPPVLRDSTAIPITRDSSLPPVLARDSSTPSILATPPKFRDSNATTSTNASKRRLAKDAPPETPIIQSLRRVLQAFAIHNPQIGYCQSLNFIAGLLLLFLEMDEEKSFILLSIITEMHLPGTHGIALEGANIDIGVLMSCIKDYLPQVWAKLDDNHPGEEGVSCLRLPTVSLATTAWFMSLFVGTLPIECVLRVWDCLFFEGSKTLFRVAMSIFKSCEGKVVGLGDPMEVFQLVQGFPRGLLDANALMEQCFRRRTGFGGISQGLIEGRRADRRRAVKEGVDAREGGNAFGKLRGRLRSTRRVGRRIETG